MKGKIWRGGCVVGFVAVCAGGATVSNAAPITSSDIYAVPTGIVGSGNGTLDFLMLTESAGGATNDEGLFNGDNANTEMPKGNGQLTSNESFITSFGEIRDFYKLNFPDGLGGSTINEIVVMVDVNETGGPQEIIVGTFDIWLNASVTPAGDVRNNAAANDISSSSQNGTNASFNGGALLASLDSSKVLGQVSVGAGFADRAIFTGIDPFSPVFVDTDRFLLHWSSSDHDNGGESIFLSGEIAGQDIVPEPGTVTLLMSGACLAMLRRRRRA